MPTPAVLDQPMWSIQTAFGQAYRGEDEVQSDDGEQLMTTASLIVPA